MDVSQYLGSNESEEAHTHAPKPPPKNNETTKTNTQKTKLTGKPQTVTFGCSHQS